MVADTVAQSRNKGKVELLTYVYYLDNKHATDLVVAIKHDMQSGPTPARHFDTAMNSALKRIQRFACMAPQIEDCTLPDVWATLEDAVDDLFIAYASQAASNLEQGSGGGNR